MSRPADPVARRIGLVLCLLVSLAPMRVSAQERVDTAEFAARRARLLAEIPDGIAVILGAGEHSYPVRFRQSPDLYYLTGLEEPGVILVLNGVTKHAAVFALKRPKFGAPDPTPELRDISEPTQRYGLPVQPMESFFTFLSFAAWNPAVQKLYVQLSPPDDLLHSRGEARRRARARWTIPYLGARPTWGRHRAAARGRAAPPSGRREPQAGRAAVGQVGLRDPAAAPAGRVGAAAVAEAIKGTHPGMYEYEIAAAAQYVNTRLGARGDAFPPIVPSGPLAPIVHYMDNTRQMQAGELVYMDYGSDWQYYTSDITRTWPVSGRFTAEQEKMYRCVLEARNAIIGAMKPGVTIASLQDVAAAVYAKYGYGKEFEANGRYIGHFVGIAVHDVIDISGARRASRSWPARCSTSSRSWSFPSARFTSGWRTR